MKSARLLTPILILVLVLCMLALTFAWFSAATETNSVATLSVGTYIKVVFDEGGLLNAEKYNGEKGYDENGEPYTGEDAAYEAYYHASLRLQGDSDLYLRLHFSELLIEVSDLFYRLSAEETLDEIISKFDGYDPSASHIGTVGTVSTDDGDQTVFSDPADGSTAFVYTTDGTAQGEVKYIRLDKVNVDKFFTLSYAKITSTTAPYEYGDFAVENEGLKFTHGPSLPAGVSEVVDDATYGKSNPLCIKITYSDADYAQPFPFSSENFKASKFRFEVLARADYD